MYIVETKKAVRKRNCFTVSLPKKAVRKRCCFTVSLPKKAVRKQVCSLSFAPQMISALNIISFKQA